MKDMPGQSAGSRTRTAAQGRLSVLPRWTHRLYAWALGRFWTPCPLCGAGFGGHEWRDRNGNMSTVPIPEHAAICPRCTRAGRAHATAAGRDGQILRTADLVTIDGAGHGIFIGPAGDDGAVLAWTPEGGELAAFTAQDITLEGSPAGGLPDELRHQYAHVRYAHHQQPPAGPRPSWQDGDSHAGCDACTDHANDEPGGGPVTLTAGEIRASEARTRSLSRLLQERKDIPGA